MAEKMENEKEKNHSFFSEETRKLAGVLPSK